MGALRTVTVVVAMGTLGMAASSPETARKSMAAIVARIQKADYEGDRKALVRLAAELALHDESFARVAGPVLARLRAVAPRVERIQREGCESEGDRTREPPDTPLSS